jgi:hypothetical protein
VAADTPVEALQRCCTREAAADILPYRNSGVVGLEDAYSVAEVGSSIVFSPSSCGMGAEVVLFSCGAVRGNIHRRRIGE